MYLVDQYEGPQAGTEGQLLQLIRHLDPSRYAPAITLLRPTRYTERNAFPCPVSLLGITRIATAKTAGRMLTYARALQREGYALAHCYFNDSSIIAPPFLAALGIRTLVSRRDMGFWYTRANLAALRVVQRWVDRYVVNSEAVKRVVQAREGVSAERISVIYNGYDRVAANDDREELPEGIATLPLETPLVGVVANVKPIKRLDVLLDAFASVASKLPEARLAIVGDSSSSEGIRTRAELQAQATRLGIDARVIFTGRVASPMSLVKRFSVAVLCSDSEGFSNSLVEYMQAGRAVVCTDTGGNAEVVKDGRNGFLVPVGDSSALGDRLSRLLTDRALAESFGRAARNAANAYTHTRMVAEHMACYDRVLAA